GGTTNITLTMTLTNPSSQTIDLGHTIICGGIGSRTQTIYHSVNQGVRANGSYRLDLVFTAKVVLLGGVVQATFSTTLHSNFTLSGFKIPDPSGPIDFYTRHETGKWDSY